MNKSSLVNPVAGATGVFIALAAALVAALAVVFVFSTKGAEAQTDDVSIRVQPINVDLSDIAAGSTEETTIKITNNGDVDATIGAIDLDILQGDLDLDDIQVLDDNGGVLDGVLDLLTGVLDLDDDLVIQPGETVELVIELLPDGEGAINITVGLLEDLITRLETVTVVGNARECTVTGTEGDDQGLTAIKDTSADEVICGRGGNDEILATEGGDDVILGGTGNDTINMKDGVRREFANGNAGLDRCKPKDKKDKVKSCGTKNKRR